MSADIAQNHAVHRGMDVYMEYKIVRLFKDGDSFKLGSIDAAGLQRNTIDFWQVLP